ncbi:MAG: 30S ribosome-binding factor RbfA [Gammaproteobacteria bacterium]|nr:30S ribosome-binding factor RbfA [Gammaproteobacteria bacterium]
MKSYKRTDRVADLIMQELATIIQCSRSNPLFTRVTITHVRLSPDFSYAKVFFTVFKEEELKQTLADLQDAAGYFQHILSSKVSLKKLPKLHFVYDESVVRGRELSSLIDKALGTISD